jgi:hypothetical protein
MKLSELFTPSYGTKLDLNKMKIVSDETGINFIGRTGRNLGKVARIERVKDIEPFPAGLITVALGGSILSSFVQQEPFYTAQNIMVLTPKNEMTMQEKIFYCICIKKNDFRYSTFGREANKTLKNLELPDKIPKWVKNTPIAEALTEKPLQEQKIKFTDRNWKYFTYGGKEGLFEIRKGKRVIVKKIRDDQGKYNFVSAIKHNNGVFCKTNLIPNQSANVITINYDGNGGVAEAFYQDQPFWALDSVNVLYPKFKLNSFIAMFLVTLMRKERWRFNYGRKWHKKRMEKSLIKLPIDESGNPDWEFMENYIKSLSYSSNLKN